MAQVTITNGEDGLDVRNALNGMFTELYANISQPIRLPGVAANTSQAIAADTYVEDIAVSGTSGAPLLRIGTTPNGQDLLPDTEIGNSVPVQTQYYFQNAGTIYFTISGGTVNIRIDYIPNYYNG